MAACLCGFLYKCSLGSTRLLFPITITKCTNPFLRGESSIDSRRYDLHEISRLKVNVFSLKSPYHTVIADFDGRIPGGLLAVRHGHLSWSPFFTAWIEWCPLLVVELDMQGHHNNCPRVSRLLQSISAFRPSDPPPHFQPARTPIGSLNNIHPGVLGEECAVRWT